MKDDVPDVSVVIPTKNAGPRFEQVLAAVLGQQCPVPFEVFVVDSGSQDGTLARCRRAGVRVLRISARHFGHGRTRNLAISLVRSRYVVLLVQDAVPQKGWLWALVRALDENPHAAGAYSRQVPRQGASRVAREVTEYWHRRQGGRVEQCIWNLDSFLRLPLEIKQQQCAFNNVSSIVRRSVWERIPFREVPFAEDVAWGWDVLRAGYSLIYEPASVVEHSHERSLKYEFRRAYIDAKTVGELFQERARPLAPKGLGRLLELWRWAKVQAQYMPLLEDETAWRRWREEWLRTWYKAHFSRETVKYIFGGASPYEEGERRWLLLSLQHRWREKAAQGAEEAPVPSLDLDARINALAWAEDTEALTEEELAFLFQVLWEDLGRDYVRRAVLEEREASGDGEFDLLQLRIWQFASEFLQAAFVHGELTEELFRRAWLYAAVVVLGRRLGEANRYGAGGRWGKLLSWWMRGV